jgi:hypothetical protein
MNTHRHPIDTYHCYKCGSPGYGGLVENTDHKFQCKNESSCDIQRDDNIEIQREMTRDISHHEAGY